MKIQYDKRINKILGVTTLFSALWNIIGWGLLFLDPGRLEWLMLGGIVIGGGLFLFSGVRFVEGLGYVRRLKAHGYEVPYNRKDYGNNLDNLPCDGEGIVSEGKSKESLVLCILFLIMFLGSNVWNLHYAVHWYGYLDETAIDLLFLLVILDLFWLIGAIVFFCQRKNRKYRDDVDTDRTRKVRVPLERGIATCFFMIVVMLHIKGIIVNMSEYVFRSRGESDQVYLEQIQRAVTGSLETNITDESYKQMEKGCYITDWTVPADEFSRAVADNLGIDDFAQLDDTIFNADGTPIIYIKITGQDVYVRMENPLQLDSGIQYPYEVKPAGTH